MCGVLSISKDVACVVVVCCITRVLSVRAPKLVIDSSSVVVVITQESVYVFLPIKQLHYADMCKLSYYATATVSCADAVCRVHYKHVQTFCLPYMPLRVFWSLAACSAIILFGRV